MQTGKVYYELWDRVHALDRGRLARFERLLEPRERAILRKRILAEDPATLASLAATWGYTRERARQIEQGLLAKVREYHRSGELARPKRAPRHPAALVELRRLVRTLSGEQRDTFLRTLRSVERIVLHTRVIPSRAETPARVAMRTKRSANRIGAMERRLLLKLRVFLGAPSDGARIGSVQHVRALRRIRTYAQKLHPPVAASLAATMPRVERLVMEWRGIASSPARLDALAAELGVSLATLRKAEDRVLAVLVAHARMWRAPATKA